MAPIDTVGPMNALALLRADHRKIKKLLAKGESTTERAKKTRAELYGELKELLTVHERIEEEVLYPALKGHPKARELALEGYEEHHVVDLVLEELDATPVSSEKWAARFKVTKENVEHHIEEEEGTMFPATRRAFERADLERMGARMEEIRSLARQVERSS